MKLTILKIDTLSVVCIVAVVVIVIIIILAIKGIGILTVPQYSNKKQPIIYLLTTSKYA